MSQSTHLPADLVRALDEAAATRSLLVASDFDGTLAPIVDNPADARPLAAAAEAVIALAALPSTHAALVSGRALAVLREYSGMPSSVHLVGSHGAEFDSGFALEVDEALLSRIAAELSAIAHGRPGVTVETKPASVALHVRNASEADGAAALAAAQAIGEALSVEITSGKRVLEFAVISTDKGEAVDLLRRQTDATAVVFLGDDVTDEKAFRRMLDTDVGVKVGQGDTLARYRVESPEDVAETLAHLLERRR
ncbi:trehalose-phosphatase [Mycobacterium antarcticum]|uniref:trehalose-phosphatase n=1 Tax=Mycolicibacterium sp. TUM20984 TaxID=3023368 RepID=UPI002384CA87|nr:trehalose-phosphatase [Mycolicibacterium sp. TUM20984]GLP79221.1 trehalose 6-phosphate phosphatase [Mycolicibacterium sp. TUM20984]